MTQLTPWAYAIGLDYGTNSCRALIVRLEDGAEMASAVYPYPSGTDGVLTDATNPHIARQHPADYIEGMALTVQQAIAKLQIINPAFSPEQVIGIGIDATGSTPLPVDAQGQALALYPDFKDNLNACAWLWKDHSAYAEAQTITQQAKTQHPEYLDRCGGAYNSEWFWAKILHCHRVDPTVTTAATSWVELCDWLPAQLTGCTNAKDIVRSACAAGHKALYSTTWGGLPDDAFLASIDPYLAALKPNLYTEVSASDKPAGTLCATWAKRLGLPEGIPVATGLLDAHAGAVGGGCCQGTPVKILGTSTCDLMVQPIETQPRPIPGISSIAESSVIPGMNGIETGQSAVGDIFLWFTKYFVPPTDEDKGSVFARLDRDAAALRPGQSGLLALDWHNGNRCLLADTQLTGLLVGETLQTQPHEVYRAWVEATAFGAKMIFDRVRDYGVQVDKLVACGGLAVKCPFLMQIYADILNVPIYVAASDQTCALGAAFFGAVVGNYFPNVETAQAHVKLRERYYTPITENVEIYQKLYALYQELHDTYGTESSLMKRLLKLR